MIITEYVNTNFGEKKSYSIYFTFLTDKFLTLIINVINKRLIDDYIKYFSEIILRYTENLPSEKK